MTAQYNNDELDQQNPPQEPEEFGDKENHEGEGDRYGENTSNEQ